MKKLIKFIDDNGGVNVVGRRFDLGFMLVAIGLHLVSFIWSIDYVSILASCMTIPYFAIHSFKVNGKLKTFYIIATLMLMLSFAAKVIEYFV